MILNIILIINIIILLSYCLRIITIDGESMSPYLHHGDKVIVIRYLFRRMIKHNSVVVFRMSDIHNTKNHSVKSINTFLMIKRVVAIENDEIIAPSFKNIIDENGKVQIVVIDKAKHWVMREHIFVMSDNRESYGDSRSFGPIPYSSIVGVVLYKISREDRSNL